MATIDASVGGIASNSFGTLAESAIYFGTRSTIQAWEDADDQSVLLIMATRVMESMLASPRKRLVRAGKTSRSTYYLISPTWTGTPATTTQALSWPRDGMYTKNGVLIPTNVIPQELKNAEFELAGQLAIGDRTLDNDVIAQGIKDIKAGSVSLSFKDSFEFDTIPGAVWSLLVQSWLTDEIFEPALKAEFAVL